ncbi:hypothetical protein Tpen_1525 [Thermofilum pendens Hrk 5]|uniref:Uncharacterized protein n=2 Tax=Thermofilum pendens TaxID=2269 RepID=A1S0E1_THEPD|nr:hypothetical protein Tpen_1525 [Thermofilum pendens Hrk 5]
MVVRLRKRDVYLYLASLLVAAFATLVLLYPLGVQAVVVGGARDVEAKPAELDVYASNTTVYCYGGALELKNLGAAGQAYRLRISASPPRGLSLLELRLNGSAVFALGAVNASREVVLPAGSSARLDLCVKASSPGSVELVFVDPAYARATESRVRVSYRLTDWWNNTFPRRVELVPVVSKPGVALFEVTGSGEVYVNGRLVRRISGIAGLGSDAFAVVLRRSGADYLLPYQVEAWTVRGDGVAEPSGVRRPGEAVWGDDRLVFAAYLENGSRIYIYMGGRYPWGEAGDVQVLEGAALLGGERLNLSRWGVEARGFSLNLSGYVVFPYQSVKEELSDPGSWRNAASGPVRTVLWFSTTGFSNYRVEAAVTLWGRGVNAALVYVWPSLSYRGIVLEWVSPRIALRGNTSLAFNPGTTGNYLPLRLEKYGVALCRDFFLSGGTYGYFSLALGPAPFAELKRLDAAYSSFPGG